MTIKKLILSVTLGLIAISACAAESNFAFVNKSFSRDLKVSMHLFQSYEKFVTPGNQPFYMVVPQSEISLFEQEFLKAKNAGELKTIPKFIADEEVFKKCGDSIYEKIMKMGGWMQQQMVKMCFYKTGLAENYMTIDSDTYFTKPFPTATLFDKDIIKTYATDKFKRNNEAEFRKKEPDLFIHVAKIKDVIGDKSSDYNNFVSGFGLWSSDVLNKLATFVEQEHGYDFADLINISPYEMQWYGNFIFTQHNDLFHPVGDIFTPIDSKIDRHNDKCFPTDGCPWHYGISYHHSTGELYTNQCSKFKTMVKMTSRRFNLYLSQLRQRIG